MDKRWRWALLGLGIWAGPLCAGPLSAGDSRQLLQGVEAGRAEMAAAALDIWGYAETGFAEERSSARLQQQLRAAGFEIETGVAGMPTAFIARYRQGQGGPVLGLLAEYDALPGLSQAAEPRRSPVPGQSAGHACGHHLFGAASVNAAIAVKRWMQATGRAGELRLYGSPAEEGGSGKVFLVRAGLVDDVDAMLHWHPSDVNDASQYRTLANISGRFRFRGVSAHAAMAPERGRSALDGVEALNFMANALREHVPQETRIHYVITDGGAAPNVVPETAEVYYYVRHPLQQEAQAVFERLRKAAEGAALGTGTSVVFEPSGGTYDLLPNDALGQVVLRHLQKVGGYQYDAQQRAFADAITPTLAGGGGPRPGPSQLLPYDFNYLRPASTDVGDVSYVTPTAGLTAATWVPGTPAHSWQAVAAGGTSIGVDGAQVAARVLALTAGELFQSPDVLKAARAEMKQRRGEGFVYRAMLGDAPPKLDYRKP